MWTWCQTVNYQSQREKLGHATNGLGFAHQLAGAAISAVIADVKRSVISLLDGGDRTRIRALAILLALFLIDPVHFASFKMNLAMIASGMSSVCDDPHTEL
jgi:hypothetical protein